VARRADRGGRSQRTGGGQAFIRALCEAQVELARSSQANCDFPVFVDYSDDVYAAVAETATAELTEVIRSPTSTPGSRPAESLKNSIVERLAPQFGGSGERDYWRLPCVDQEGREAADPDRQGSH
jgi:hypothetical protein